jgi:hypothetical protein
MDRARRAALAALVLACSVSPVAGAGLESPSGESSVAAVGWPTSSLVVSEVQTGGASASDEFIELANAGSASVDLAGLELVYVTASGSTITQKATWSTARPIDPGRHFLLANVSGVFAALADVTYSGGLASTGGAIVLRPIGGSPIDAVGWGDATNAFVEGAAVVAPAAGSSIEREPGGDAGNDVDSNDNASDFFVQAVPAPQDLGSPATPGPGVTPTPPASPTPTATPSATSTPTPTATPVPTEVQRAIADVRRLPNGTTATIAGTLTTALGALEDQRSGFVQDPSGGIALYFDAAVAESWPAGTTIFATGGVDDRYGQRSLRVAASDVVATGAGIVPAAVAVATGTAREALEGTRVVVIGVTVGAPSALADGTGLLVDDGSGELRVIVAPVALGGVAVPSGTTVSATGPLGQRDSSGTGTSGYRLYATEPGAFAVLPAPTPTPAATASPTPTPAPGTTPTPAPSASPSATPSPTASPTPVLTVISIADARTRPVGATVSVVGVLTAEPGRLGLPHLAAIQDGTAGIAVRLPEPFAAAHRGARVQLTGVVAEPYGQRELRSLTNVVSLGDAAIPAALAVQPRDLGEGLEGRLVTVSGVVVTAITKSTSGDLAFDIEADGARLRIVADASSGLTRTSLVRHASYRLTGVVGQRATAAGRRDGYRVWLRDGQDVERLSEAGTPAPPASATPTPTPTQISIARALLTHDRTVTVEGRVTAPATLLDATGRRVVVEDATAAIEVLLPTGAAGPAIGRRLALDGTVVRAYGAPRLRATAVRVVGSAATPAVTSLRGAPTTANEWRLVRVSGTVTDVHRLGDRWRAELSLGRDRVPIVGLPGAHIPSTTLADGRRASIVGIVRRASPGATDRRFAIEPRSARDIDLGPAVAVPGAAGRKAGGQGSSTSPASSTPAGPIDVDIAALAHRVGQVVRVGGLIVEVLADGAQLDDGTATGRIVLTGEATAYATLLEEGDAVNATGVVARRGDELVVVVDDAAGLARAGDLDPGASPLVPSASPSSSPSPSRETRIAASAGPFGSLGIPGAAGLASLMLLSVASAVVTVLRRRRVRPAFLAALASRVDRRGGQPLRQEARPDGPEAADEPTGPPPM